MTQAKKGFWQRLKFWKKKEERPKLNDAKTGPEVQKVILAGLGVDRKWYAIRSRRSNWAWNGLTFLAILFASLASILAAVNQGALPNPGAALNQDMFRISLIVLPALSALCGTLLVQFRFQEVCRIRDQGRITVEKLICRAYLMPTGDLARALEVGIGIRLEAHQLEEDQLAQITGSDRPRSTRRD